MSATTLHHEPAQAPVVVPAVHPVVEEHKAPEKAPEATPRVKRDAKRDAKPKQAPSLSPLSAESMAQASREVPTASIFGLVDLLLRDRPRLVERIDAQEGLLEVSRVMLVTTLLCTAIFGASVGMFRGGEQILYAALKLPLAVLLTAALCAPVISVMRMVFQRQQRVQQDVALLLSALALCSLMLAALAPLLPLARSFGAQYHELILLTAMCAGLSGLTGLHFFTGGLLRWVRHERITMALVLLSVFAMVGSQMIWTLRPYVVRPKTQEIPFVRSLEGNFLQSINSSVRSMMGIYDHDPLSSRSPEAGAAVRDVTHTATRAIRGR